MPTSPSYAGATTEDTSPSNSTLSGDMTETFSIRVSSLCHLVGVRDDIVDPAGHEERLLRKRVEFARDDALERRDRVLELHVLARDAGELLGHCERLRHEALQTPRAADDELVFFRQLVHAENRDDVLQLLVPLENALHRRGDRVVPVAEELRIEDS